MYTSTNKRSRPTASNETLAIVPPTSPTSSYPTKYDLDKINFDIKSMNDHISDMNNRIYDIIENLLIQVPSHTSKKKNSHRFYLNYQLMKTTWIRR